MDRQTADYIGALSLTTVDLPTLVYLAPPSFKAPSSEVLRYALKNKMETVISPYCVDIHLKEEEIIVFN